MSIFPRFRARLIPLHKLPKYYIKNGKKHKTIKIEINENHNDLTDKEKYIGAFLDGYFSDKNLDYGFTYFNELEKAKVLAVKKWKRYIKNK